MAFRKRETHSFEVSKSTAIDTTIVESFKQCVRTVGQRDMTIADVGRDLSVKSVDVRGILRENATTYVPYARTSKRKESVRWNSFIT